MDAVASNACRSNERKHAKTSRGTSWLATAARLLLAPAAAYLAVVGVVHAFDSPEAPAAMSPGAVLVVAAAEVSATHAAPFDFACN